jgi:hypothetical protein
MSTAATTPAPTTEPSRAGRLLDLVRRLIEYGKELATTLRQSSVTTDLAAAMRPFGTRDIALILARITRGLHRAAALEARLVRGAARLDAEPRPRSVPAAAKPASAPRRQAAPPAGSTLAHLPTPEQIAAEVRRRPIGAVIADICRDLGIMPSHPLWRQLQIAIIGNGGNPARLAMAMTKRAIDAVAATWPPGMVLKWPAPGPPFQPAPGTGPP